MFSCQYKRTKKEQKYYLFGQDIFHFFRQNLECKVFGGANVGGAGSLAAIGSKNSAFIRAYASKENLRIVSSDLGGTKGRRILFDPYAGKAWRRFIQGGDVQAIAKREARLSAHPPEMKKPANNIELF